MMMMMKCVRLCDAGDTVAEEFAVPARVIPFAAEIATPLDEDAAELYFYASKLCIF